MASTYFSQVKIYSKFGVGQSLDFYFACLGFSSAWLGAVSLGMTYLLPSLILKKSETTGYEQEKSGQISFIAIIFSLIFLFLSLIIFLVTQKKYNFQFSLNSTLILLSSWIISFLSVVISIFQSISISYGFFRRAFVVGMFPSIFTIIYLSSSQRPYVLGLALVQLFGFLMQASFLFTNCKSNIQILIPSKKSFFKLIGPLFYAFISTLCFSGYAAVDSIVGPLMGEGILSYQTLAQKIVISVSSIIIAGPLFLSPSYLSILLQKSDYEKLWIFFVKCSSILIILFGFIAAIFHFVGLDLVRLAFEKGKFTPKDSVSLKLIILTLLFGAGPMLSTTVSFRIFFALQDYKFPAIIGISWLCLYLILTNLLKNHFEVLGLSIAYTVTWFLLFLVSYFYLRKKIIVKKI